jgi:hypothetical protein
MYVCMSVRTYVCKTFIFYVSYNTCFVTVIIDFILKNQLVINIMVRPGFNKFVIVSLIGISYLQTIE